MWNVLEKNASLYNGELLIWLGGKRLPDGSDVGKSLYRAALPKI